MTNELQKGDLVKFSNPESIEESELIMVVVEDRDSRVLVSSTKPISKGSEFYSQSAYRKSDLIKINN